MKQKFFILLIAGLTLGGLVFGMFFYRDELSKVFASVGGIHNYFQNALVLGGGDREPGAILDVDGNVKISIKSAACLGTDANGIIIASSSCGGGTTPTNPTCGSANGVSTNLLDASNPNLCVGWSASNFTLNGTKYTWNCGPVSCNANKIVCGSDNNKIFADGTSLSSNSTNLCINSVASNFILGIGDKYTWNCGTSVCSATQQTNGACGYAPNVCSKGTSIQSYCINKTDSNGVFLNSRATYYCAGINGGTDSSSCGIYSSTEFQCAEDNPAAPLPVN